MISELEDERRWARLREGILGRPGPHPAALRRSPDSQVHLQGAAGHRPVRRHQAAQGPELSRSAARRSAAAAQAGQACSRRRRRSTKNAGSAEQAKCRRRRTQPRPRSRRSRQPSPASSRPTHSAQPAVAVAARGAAARRFPPGPTSPWAPESRRPVAASHAQCQARTQVGRSNAVERRHRPCIPAPAAAASGPL